MASVRYVHRVLPKALGDAVGTGGLIRNLAVLADPAQAEHDQPVGPGDDVWTAAQLHAFLDRLDGQRLAPAFVLAARTGMRRGEIAGLRWSDVTSPPSSSTSAKRPLR